MTTAAEQSRAAWASRGAFAIALAIVVARCLMLEVVRDAQVTPANAPSGPGATTSLVFDWLCLVPVALLFTRRLFDETFTLRFTLVHALACALAGWTLLSVAWADDKFAALVGAMNVAGGVALFWTFGQIVRRWDHVRVVAGIAAGILLANVAQAAIFRGVEYPALKEMWAQNKDKILAENNWQPTDYAAKRFEAKLLAGELLGFNASPNTLAAMCVMCGLIALGAAAQRADDRDDPGWTGVCAIVGLSALFPLAYTGSKGAYATLCLGLVLLAGWRLTRRWLAAHRPLVFSAGCCAVALGVAAVIAYGLTTGGLPSDSLNFRWRYWTGAWPMALAHPLRGVGWANFGDHYLAHRVPAAAEEINDPHDLFVRWATELGGVGLTLGVVWLALWAWRAAQPARRPTIAPAPADATPAYPATPDGVHRGGVRMFPLLAVVGLAFVLNAAGSIDFAAGDADHVYYVVMELLKRVVLFAAVAIALAGVTLAARRDERGAAFVGRHVDERPAPWLAAALFVGAAMLLLQSTIDIAFFEPGPFALTLSIMGALVGLAVDGRPARRDSLTLVALITGGVVALAMLVVVVVPVGVAEYLAGQGDEYRQRQPQRALDYYADAMRWTPVSNWSYPDRAAGVAIAGRDPRAPAMLDAVVDADPSRAIAYLNRARLRSATPAPDANAIAADYERATALNPNDVDVRIEYAAALERLGRPAEAARQLFAALAADDLLDPAEPKRLPNRSPGTREQLQARAAQLQAQGG